MTARTVLWALTWVWGATMINIVMNLDAAEQWIYPIACVIGLCAVDERRRWPA